MRLFFLLILSCISFVRLHAGKDHYLNPTDIQVSKASDFLNGETPSINMLDGIPNVIIHNHVNAISGTFFDSQKDLELGPFGFFLERTYTSGDATRGSLLHGWNHNFEEVLEIEILERRRYAISKGRSGGEFLYHGDPHKPLLTINSKNFKKGATNCIGGELSGRTNVVNNVLTKTSDRQFILKTGSGKKNVFDKALKQKHRYQIVKQRTPSQHRLSYSYNNDTERLKEVCFKNPGIQKLASFKFTHPTEKQLKKYKNNSENKPVISVAASDGRTVKYTLESFKKKFKDDKIDKIRYRIIKVRRPNAPPEWYEYGKCVSQIPEKVIRKNRPDGRYLLIDYFTNSKKVLNEKVKELKGPVGTDKNPTTLYTFFYEKNGNKGTTYLKNALGHQTIYHYSTKNHRLESLDKFYGVSPYSLHSTEKLEWSDESEGSKLLARKLVDFNQNEIMCRRYEYDKHGNILKDITTGNIRGKSTNDSSYKTFTYSNDGYNLPLSISEGSVTQKMRYKPYSDKLIAKYTTAGEFKTREFYEYDINHAVSLIIIDDGLGDDLNDLSGVTQRTFQKITNTLSGSIGLPEIIEYGYLDLATSTEVLLKKIVNIYDGWGRILEEQTYDNQGQYAFSKRWEYNDFGQKTLEVNPYGACVRYTYDANGNMLTEDGPQHPRLKKFTYDLNNNLIKREIIDKDATYVERLMYDEMGRKAASIDIYGNKKNYEFDALNQLCKITYPVVVGDDGCEYRRLEFNDYDILGNISKFKDGRGNVTSTNSTIRGKPFQIIHPDGAVESFEYSLKGEMIRHVRANGTVLIVGYDELSRPVLEQNYSASGELITTHQKRYNAFHLIEEINGDGLITRYSYDGAGRMQSVINGAHHQTISYDSLGRKSTVSDHCDNDTIVHTTVYDFLDRVIKETTSNSTGELQQYKEYEYDLDSNRTAVKTTNLAGESIIRIEYNVLGQIIKQTDPLGNVTHTFYDMNISNNRAIRSITTVDPLGNSTALFYNQLDQVTSEVHKNTMGSIIKQKDLYYDRAGNVSSRVDHVFAPNGTSKLVKTIWSYDARNRLVGTTEAHETPFQRTVLRTYDIMGNLATLTKADGVIFNYHYDPLGRLQEYVSSDGSVHYSFEYNFSDNPTKIVDHVSGNINIRHYDQNQRLSREDFANGLSLSYLNDSLGRIRQIFYQDGSSSRYTYNGEFLIQVERVDNNNVVSYEHHFTQHDLSGNVIRSQLISDLGEIAYKFDLCNRLSGIKTPYWEVESMTYDAVGNLNARVWDTIRYSYVYDDLYQLNSEVGAVTNTYQNDSMFNQIAVNDVQREFNDVYELQDVYKYDANGNAIQKGNLIFTYDALNRLKTVRNGEAIVEYNYDSFHRRISKNSGVTERYFYHYDLELGSVNPQDEIKELRLLGKCRFAEVGAAVAIELFGKIYAPLHDSQGNIVTLVDINTGEVAESSRYSAYGQEIEGCLFGARLSPWRCSSKRNDNETGFIYFGRRFYDPLELRWISLDPVLISEGTNRYNYLENNPFKYIDPDGRFIQGAIGSLALSFLDYVAVAIVGVSLTAAIVAPENSATMSEPYSYTFDTGYCPSSYSREASDHYPLLNLDCGEIRLCDATIECPVSAPGTIATDDAKSGGYTVYAPERKLPRGKHGIDLPDSPYPHTQLSTKDGSKGPYPQAREFDANGKKVRDIDFTDHGKPHIHLNPHQHTWSENPTGGSLIRDEGVAVTGWSYI